MKEFYKMSDERKWDKGVVVDWYKSQMHVIGKHELADVFDFMALYTQPVIGLDVVTKLINDSSTALLIIRKVSLLTVLSGISISAGLSKKFVNDSKKLTSMQPMRWFR